VHGVAVGRESGVQGAADRDVVLDEEQPGH